MWEVETDLELVFSAVAQTISRIPREKIEHLKMEASGSPSFRLEMREGN